MFFNLTNWFHLSKEPPYEFFIYTTFFVYIGNKEVSLQRINFKIQCVIFLIVPYFYIPLSSCRFFHCSKIVLKISVSVFNPRKLWGEHAYEFEWSDCTELLLCECRYWLKGVCEDAGFIVFYGIVWFSLRINRISCSCYILRYIKNEMH